MSVQTEINRINQNIASTYTALGDFGATMPTTRNSANLAATAGTVKAVLYSTQTLTEAQKSQARANIGAQATLTDADIETIVQRVLAVLNPDAPTYTNKLTTSVDSSGNPYNGGQGWKANTRLNSSGVEVAYNGIEVTGFIPVKFGDTIHFCNITCGVTTASPVNGQQYLCWYDANKTKLFNMQVSGYYNQFWNHNEGYNGGMDANGNIAFFYLGSTFRDVLNSQGVSADDVAYFRISCEEINANSIITINETID